MPTPPRDFQVERHPDGNATVRFQNGDSFALTRDGICADVSAVSAIGIKHLDEVASHTVNDIAQSRSHVIRFVNGGLLQYAYNSAGELIELSAHNLGCRLSSNNELLFYQI
ncbi:hypothetical protein AAKU55_005098 [Oxalobacteraceae bacterium GrIS 1.11]